MLDGTVCYIKIPICWFIEQINQFI